MAESFTPSVEGTVNPGPTLEEQAVEMGIMNESGEMLDPDAVQEEQQLQQDLILGKFQDQQALEQAYTELEQRMGQQSPSTDSAVAMSRASEFYTTNGYLDDANYAALDQLGLNKSTVDQYIQGLQASVHQQQTTYYERTGGEAGYQAMAGWMAEYLPDGEINAYNRVLDTGSDEEVGVIISGMYARYQSAMGGYNQVQGSTVPEVSGPQGFASRGQVMQALGDPRYEYDAAYRQEVEDKLAMTPENIF